MPEEQLLAEGNLDEALAELQGQVRKDPSNPKHRVFLFQLLAVRGEWNRALVQLNVLGEMDPGSLAMVHTYREALRCEALRCEVFAGTKSPVVLGDPPPWIAHLIEALKLTAQDLHKLNVIDAIVDEPLGGAHRGKTATIASLGDQIEKGLRELTPVDGPTLKVQRREKFLEMGRKGVG